MNLSESQLNQFKRMSFHLLSTLFSLEDRREPILDVKPIGERIEDVERDVEERLEKTIEFSEALSYIFGSYALPRDDQEKALRTESILTKMAAEYDPRTNTIRLTSYPDTNSVLKFYQHFKIPFTKPPKKIKEEMSNNMMLEETASEIGHACRALARGYAYTSDYTDNLFIVSNKDTGVTFLNSNSIVKKKEEMKEIVKTNNQEMRLRVDMSEFFDGVAMNEVSGFMEKIGAYQYTPTSYEKDLHMLKSALKLSPVAIVNGSPMFNSAANVAISGALEHLPLTFALWLYKNEQNRAKLREEIYNGLIYESPVELFRKFLAPPLADYLLAQ